jgi:hypothetical protein
MSNPQTTQAGVAPRAEFLDPAPASDASERPVRDGGRQLFSSPGYQKDTLPQFTRLAGRLNASAASEEERQRLLGERQNLLDRHFAGTITRKEAVRLEYVRWSLDRIEDARHGGALDSLEKRIEQFEKLAEQLQAMTQELQRVSNRRR